MRIKQGDIVKIGETMFLVIEVTKHKKLWHRRVLLLREGGDLLWVPYELSTRSVIISRSVD
mgnify:CR=1 FL=1